MSTSKAQETGQDKFRKLTNLVLMIHKVTKQKKEELDDEVILKSDPRAINILKENAEERSDRELDLAHFKSLFNVFRQYTAANRSKHLNFEEFESAFSSVLGHNLSSCQMRALFNKIDVDTDDRINWDDFSEFMLLRAEGQKQMKEESETQLFVVDGQAPHPTPHRDFICKIHYSPSARRFVTVSRDSTIAYWSETLRLQRSFKNVGFKMDPKKMPSEQQSIKALVKQRWVQDFALMENIYSIAIATDDHEISIYDTATMTKTHILNIKDSCALTMDYWKDTENPDSDMNRLVYGTDSGNVCVFDFPDRLIVDRGTRKKDSHLEINMEYINNKPAKYFGSLIKRNAHNDWVLKVRYYHNMKSIVSCSSDPNQSISIATENNSGKWKVMTAPVPKGVHCFAYCKLPVALVTAGYDRKIRIWNPRKLDNPFASLKGHMAPIIDIKINPVTAQIISLSHDKTIKVWDLRHQQCLQTISDSPLQRPKDIFSCIMFNKEQGGRLIAASSTLTVFNIQEKVSVQAEVKSHDFPVRNLLLNPAFGQVVSGCNGGVVNIWDIVTGAKTFRFSEVHGSAEITAMTFDGSGRRLITGGRDGTIRVWNFNNGQLLQELLKEDKTEVTDIVYVDMADVQYIVVTGWNRKVTAFRDFPDQYHVYPTTVIPAPGQDDVWHKDDILTMAFCPPNTIATGSYDGIIIVTNIQSGFILHVFNPFEYEMDTSIKVSIDKALLLPTRIQSKEAASLITSGSDGTLRFWNTQKGRLLWKTDATNGRKEGIYCLLTDKHNRRLFTADAAGWVSVWDIRRICTTDEMPKSMPLLVEFRAHAKPIAAMVWMELSEMILTSSTDCTVRINTVIGDHIGIFGQQHLWDLTEPASYADQDYPEDVINALESEEEERQALEKLQLSLSTSRNKVMSPAFLGRSGSRKTASMLKSREMSMSSDQLREQQKSLAKFRSTELLKPNLATWYSNTIFAKESVLEKIPHKRMPLGASAIARATKDRLHGAGNASGALRLYQHLEPYELEAVRLPALKPRGTIVSPPSLYRE